MYFTSSPCLIPPEYMATRHTPHSMNLQLLKAVATGNADLLAQVLGVWSTTTAEQGDQSCLRGVTAEGSSALHIAASRGYLELVVMIYTQDRSLIKSRNNQLDTPLICAARAGHADVVRYLIERALAEQEAGYPVLRAWNSAGATAMHEAVKNGHAPVLRKLMSADSRLAAMVDGKGVSPLYLAVVASRADMIEILVEESSDSVRSPASYAGPDGQTALHAAVYFGKGMSESLQRWEPTLGKKVDNYGRTALHYAALAGRFGVVKCLLGNSSLAYIPDNDGLFPVHHAAIAGKVKVIREFMEICPNCDELLDKKGRNILHCAVEHGRVMVVLHICANQTFASMMNAGDGEGNTPLHLAVKHGRKRIHFILMMHIRVNLNVINNVGLTAHDVVVKELNSVNSFSKLMDVWIFLCLHLSEAYLSPRNLIDEHFMEDKENESSIYANVSQSIVCIPLLIAAGSFAATYAVPGGYGEDERVGLPVFAGTYGFFGFVSGNTASFYISTVAICLLAQASLTTMRMRDRRFFLAVSVMMAWVAVGTMITTFSNSVRLTLDPANDDERVLIYIIAVCDMVMFWAIYWPATVLLVPICLRAAIQLRRSKHPWRDRLKLIAGAGTAIYTIYVFIIDMPTTTIQVALQARQDRNPATDTSGVIHGDATFLFPT
ncbi:hypothetical protein ACP70R_035427 [Stipagrostis hirtigluma subsp. patula]